MSIQFTPQQQGLFGEIKNVFRWYDTPNKRNSFRQHCKGMCGYKLYTPINQLLPFQLPRETSDSTIVSWEIYDSDDSLVCSLNTDLLQIVQFTDKDYIIYDGRDIGYLFECGTYTSIISDGTNTWYSEEFYVMPHELGSNLMLESTPFDCFTQWPGNSGFTCDGQYRPQANAANGYLTSDEILSAVTMYEVIITIGGRTTGSVELIIGDGDSIVLSGNGTFRFAGYSELGTDIKLVYSNSWDGYLQNISAKEVTYNEQYCNIKLEWTQSCGGNIGNIYYGVPFTNVFYFEPTVELSDPIPNVEREASLNGNKRAIPQWQKRTTKYKLEEAGLPWYVIDALVEAMLHDSITITVPNGIGTETIIEYDVDVNWDEQGAGCYGTCTITFELDDATVVTGCCSDEFATVEAPQCCYTLTENIYSKETGTKLKYLCYNGACYSTCISNPPSIRDTSELQECLDSMGLGTWTIGLSLRNDILSQEILELTICQTVPVTRVFEVVGFEEPINGISNSGAFVSDC